MDILEKLDRGQRILTLLGKMDDRAKRMRLEIGPRANRSHELWMKRMARIIRIQDACCDEINER